MEYKGFIVHHSRCSSINGKGFDFWVDLNGEIIAAPLLTAPDYIHICLEGDYGAEAALPPPDARRKQLFAASKLVIELSKRFRIAPLLVEPHGESCPGSFFPWNELVIYPSGGYH